MNLLKPWDYSREELAHMLHSRRKAEIEVLANACTGDLNSGCSGLSLCSYLVGKISLSLDECNA